MAFEGLSLGMGAQGLELGLWVSGFRFCFFFVLGFSCLALGLDLDENLADPHQATPI